MEKVTTVLARKRPYFNTVSSDVTISDALHRMSCENTDCLIVMEEGSFLGVLTEHDIASKAMFTGRPLNKTAVKEMMNTRLPVATSDDSLERCMKLMRQFNVRYLPVFENFDFCGIVSSDDILQEAVINRAGIFDEEDEKGAFIKIY